MEINFGPTTRSTLYCYNKSGVIQAISFLTNNFEYIDQNMKPCHTYDYSFKCDDGEVICGGLGVILTRLNAKFGDIFNIRYSSSKPFGDADIITNKPHDIENSNYRLIFSNLGTTLKEDTQTTEGNIYADDERQQTEEIVSEDFETDTATDEEPREEDKETDRTWDHQETAGITEELVTLVAEEEETNLVDLDLLDYSDIENRLPGTDWLWKDMKPPKIGKRRVYELAKTYGIELDTSPNVKVVEMSQQFKKELMAYASKES